MNRSGPLKRAQPLQPGPPPKRRTPLRSKPKSATVQLDALLRAIVLARGGHQCAMGASGRTGCTGGLQAAHVMPKGTYPSMRYELDNVICLCAYHHVYGRGSWHKDPVGAVAWFEATYGAERLARLRQLALVRRGRPEPKLMRLYLAQELAKADPAYRP